ncbi:hypothetical protein PIB30_113604, partial [Stylosanthes scabra]|nr:hypothetical protein [Stylosanthes scabra]
MGNLYMKLGKDIKIWLENVLAMYFRSGCNYKPSMMRFANGSLRTKTPEEALELIELVATNQYMNFSERSTMRKGVLEVDSVNALMTQLSTISKKLEKLEASA